MVLAVRAVNGMCRSLRLHLLQSQHPRVVPDLIRGSDVFWAEVSRSHQARCVLQGHQYLGLVPVLLLGTATGLCLLLEGPGLLLPSAETSTSIAGHGGVPAWDREDRRTDGRNELYGRCPLPWHSLRES